MSDNPSIEKTSYTGVLHILDLVIPVNIGVTEQERSQKQDISISGKLTFKELPKGSFTDKIEDTICYDSLCNEIRAHLQSGEFNLIERISRDLHEIIDKKEVFSNIQLNIKKNPNIEGLNGGVAMEISTLDTEKNNI